MRFLALFLLILPRILANVPFSRTGSKQFKKEPGHPVILVPGDGGNQLEAKLTGKPSVLHWYCSKTSKDYFGLWLNLEFILPPFVTDCLVDNMSLKWNNETNMSEDNPGVDIRVPGFGDTETVEWLDPSNISYGLYFSFIVDEMASWGYTRGKNVFGAPYDWRRSPDELHEYYVALKNLTENVYRWNGNKKVVILGHSMGNPIMLYFYHHYVDQAWKDKYIKSHVSLAAPWGGSMQIVKLYSYGYNLGQYRFIMEPWQLKPMQRTFTSSAFLFPSPAVWGLNETLAITRHKNYSLSNVEEFFKNISYETGYEQYKKAAFLNDPLESPGVPFHCVYGTHVTTPLVLSWYYYLPFQFPSWKPYEHMGDGDGTVNRRSAEVCGRWIGKNNGYPVTMHDIPKTDHMQILQSPPMMEIVRKAIYDEM